MPVTEAMIEAGCEARHTKRSWRRAVNDAGMQAWVHSHREAMKNILTAAIEAGDRDPNEIWEAYLEEVPEGWRSLQGALAFGYAAGRP